MLGDEEGCVAIDGLCTVRLILLTNHTNLVLNRKKYLVFKLCTMNKDN